MTYGPGALLEGPQGPRIIPSADIGLFNATVPGVGPEVLEISDPRVSQGLLGGARLFRLPSNAEFGYGDNWYFYRTRPFPDWSLCLNSTAHGGRWAVLYQSHTCPVCGQGMRSVSGQVGQSNQTLQPNRATAAPRRQQAIRFVRACAEGHLDDVDWPRVVHRPGSACMHSSYFRWHGIGGALAQIRLECPACGDQEQLGHAYGRAWPCSGRHPEREPSTSGPQRPGCTEAARIVQRQASNLRLPELRTLFTIPPRATRLHLLLQLPAVMAVLSTLHTMHLLTEESVRTMLAQLVAQRQVPPTTAEAVFAHPWNEILAAVNDILTPVRTTFEDLLAEEFEALMSASVNGAPPVQGAAQGAQRPARVVFQVNRNDVRRVRGPQGQDLRVTPVSKLRTVTAQVGYRREVPRRTGSNGTPARVVPVDFVDNRQQRWYPAVEYLGEGLFLTLDAADGWHPPLAGPAPKWAEASSAAYASNYSDYLFRGSTRRELHPVFVWWHTLAHLLIRSVSIDAGYSSSAIRERVFLEVDGVSGRARGGVILYATQPGSEGTLGGLIALVPHFERILERAVDMAQACSNDPLCGQEHFRPGRHNGPSCYGCLLVSETSCEHRNLWLDRELFLANLP